MLTKQKAKQNKTKFNQPNNKNRTRNPEESCKKFYLLKTTMALSFPPLLTSMLTAVTSEKTMFQ